MHSLVTRNEPWLSTMEFFSTSFASGRDTLPGHWVCHEEDDKRHGDGATEEAIARLSADPRQETLRLLVEERPKRIYNYHGLRSFLLDCQAREDSQEDYPRVVHYFCGEPGSGKSHSARAWLTNMMESHGDALAYCNVMFTPSGFCLGYDGGRYVLIDDWEPRSLPPEAWNRLLDDYRTKVNIKGGEIAWKPRYIAITRTHMPQDLVQYGLKLTDLVQIIRRFTAIVICSRETIHGVDHHSTEVISPQDILKQLTPNPN